jgi:CRISPR-associated protein Cas2
MFCLVCFDIVDDRVRYRAVKILKSFGVRVQKSVFECDSLTEEQYVKLQRKLEECIDCSEDSVRYYILCRHCVTRVEYSGIGDGPRSASYRVC